MQYSTKILLCSAASCLALLSACGGPGAPDAGVAPGLDAATSTDGAASIDATTGADAGAPLRVLFVGNSYTYFNDLPAVVRALGAATPGASVEVEAITQGGALLQDHWSTTGAAERIQAGGLDAVVLQGQSVEPFASPESFHYHADLFSDAIAESGARGVWFSTWARRAGDPIYTGTFTPADMTESLEFRYRSAAMRHGDMVARVGAAWMIALAELPEVVLHTDDGSHPTTAGSLLAACVILQAITGQTPRIPDPPPLEVPRATADALCAIAPRVQCPEGRIFCEGTCVDPMQDPLHCSRCGAACADGDPCRAGVCGCDAGLSGCDRICYDLATSPDHCGECGTSCLDGRVCEAGSCVCPAASAQAIGVAQLVAADPECTDLSLGGTLACNRAAHGHCAALDCFTSGFGPPSGHAPMPDAVMCVDGEVRETTYTTLQTFLPACDGVTERLGAACATAIHRYCASVGAVSGFGPVESEGDALTVTCLPSAIVVPTTRETLAGFASRCLADPVTCGIAAWNYCASLGHLGGYGPVEDTGSGVDVVCLEP